MSMNASCICIVSPLQTAIRNLIDIKELETDMSILEQIEAAILRLPADEFQRLRQWFFDVDYQ